jgi:UV DNA damage endonuclease
MLGVCCQWLEEKKTKTGSKYVNKVGERALQLGRFQSGEYSADHIRSVWLGNIAGISNTTTDLRNSGVGMFRIGSSLLPLFDKISPDSGLVEEAAATLKEVSLLFKGFRLTMHPGQFVVLNSDSDLVVENSIRELTYHAFIMDCLGAATTPHFAINVHGGKRGNADKLLKGIDALPANVRQRLTLENDENCWSVADLLPISHSTGVPIVYDSHHHVFNDGGMSGEDAMLAAACTWPRGIRSLQHLSNTEPGLEGGNFTERRAHSWAIKQIPEHQKQFYIAGESDIEMECKGKNLGFIPYLDMLEIAL